MNASTTYFPRLDSHKYLTIVPEPIELDDKALLAVTKATIELQTDLLKSSISYAQSVSGSLILKTTLRNTLGMIAKYTKAEEGSIFLIDEDGVILQSILARGAVTRDVKDELITRVLDDGLAGWALRHRQIGLVSDSNLDERWQQLPDQPYTARSALAVPLIYGIDAIGMITLTHSQTNHFDGEIAILMQYCMESVAAIVLNAQLHSEYRPLS